MKRILCGLTAGILLGIADHNLVAEVGKDHVGLIALKDQNRKEFRFAFPGPEVAVFMVSRRDASDLAMLWGAFLEEGYGDEVRVQGVASLKSVPFFSRSLVRPFVARLTKHPVLLDWQGVFPVPEKKRLLIRVVRECGFAEDLSVEKPTDPYRSMVAGKIRSALESRRCGHCEALVPASERQPGIVR